MGPWSVLSFNWVRHLIRAERESMSPPLILDGNQSFLMNVLKLLLIFSQVIFTLGRHSQDVKTLEKLLRAGMTVAKFDTSVSSEDDLQEGLANLRNAMASTHITCHVVLEKKVFRYLEAAAFAPLLVSF